MLTGPALFVQLLRGGWVHPHDFKVVAVEIVEAPTVHEAMILRGHGVLASCVRCAVDAWRPMCGATGR